MDELLNAIIASLAQGQSQRFNGQKPNKSQEPKQEYEAFGPRRTADSESLLKDPENLLKAIKDKRELANQYFQAALAFKQEADKLEAVQKAQKLHFEEDLRPIPAVKYNNKVERFAREQDANNYAAYLIENGAKPEDIETFNIDINMNPRFWRA